MRPDFIRHVSDLPSRDVIWPGENHPEIDRPEALPPDELIVLANEFEGGRVRANRGLRESWRVGFIDYLYERHSDFEESD